MKEGKKNLFPGSCCSVGLTFFPLFVLYFTFFAFRHDSGTSLWETWECWSVGWSTTKVQTEISQQWLDVLYKHLWNPEQRHQNEF